MDSFIGRRYCFINFMVIHPNSFAFRQNLEFPLSEFACACPTYWACLQARQCTTRLAPLQITTSKNRTVGTSLLCQWYNQIFTLCLDKKGVEKNEKEDNWNILKISILLIFLVSLPPSSSTYKGGSTMWPGRAWAHPQIKKYIFLSIYIIWIL